MINHEKRYGSSNTYASHAQIKKNHNTAEIL